MIQREAWCREARAILPDEFYHLTTEAALPRILKEGLSPTSSQSSLQAVFLTDDPWTAENYKHMRSSEDHVLLGVGTSYLDPNELGPDNVEFQDYLDSLSEQDEGWEEANWDEFSWEKSLEAVSQVAYHGTIPPEALRVVKRYPRNAAVSREPWHREADERSLSTLEQAFRRDPNQETAAPYLMALFREGKSGLHILETLLDQVPELDFRFTKEGFSKDGPLRKLCWRILGEIRLALHSGSPIGHEGLSAKLESIHKAFPSVIDFLRHTRRSFEEPYADKPFGMLNLYLEKAAALRDALLAVKETHPHWFQDMPWWPQ